MVKVRFVVHGEPMGKQRPRVVTRGEFSKAYTPKQTVNYENLVKTEYMMQTNNYRFPDEAMLDVRILAFYSIPMSTSKRRKSLMLNGEIRPTKKPDVDNIEKIICDSLNKIAYKDDSCIVEAQVRKFYSDLPRVEVTIKEVVQ